MVDGRFYLRLEATFKIFIPRFICGLHFWAWDVTDAYKIKTQFHMLVLFPFVRGIYKKRGYSVTSVGLAAQIPHE